jgi:hypothetical protein
MLLSSVLSAGFYWSQGCSGPIPQPPGSAVNCSKHPCLARDLFPEQLFPYAGSSLKKKLATGISFVLGLGLAGLGVLIASRLPLKTADYILAGLPLWACGILCIWISIRYPTRCIQVTPQGITLKGYFRTVAMPWQSVLALTAREHFVLTVGGFLTTGVLYSLYSDRRKLTFSSHLPENARLASLVTEATGLTWNPKPV